MELHPNFLMAFLLTMFAGLSTGIGSAIAFLTKKNNKTFLSVSMGFSGGVMIYVSFVEILGKSRESLGKVIGDQADLYSTLAFFGGILLILFIDKLIPSYENPHEPHKIEATYSDDFNPGKLKRVGVFAALVIAIHNFPEGLATFISGLDDISVGISISVAIAIHNIPEGIAVSVPLYFSTGSRKKAFWLSFLSGLAEPVGALLGYFVLRPFFSDVTYGLLFGVVAGIMVFISLDELLPTARDYDSGHKSIYALVLGMAIMALSLLLF